MKSGKPQLIHKNKIAVFGWSFITLWMVFVFFLTGVYFNGEGKYQDLSIPLPFFWIIGLFTLVWLFRKPIVSLYIYKDEPNVHIIERYPFRKFEHKLPFETVKGLEVFESKDTEGDPYFSCELTVLRGSRKKTIALVEGHSKELVLAKLNEIKNKISPDSAQTS